MNSPITAPITDKVTAILAPEKIDGRAEGNCILKKVCNRVHCSERASSSSSGDVERRPVAVSTTTGKKAITKAIASFDLMPVPNQTSRIGATATFGMDWLATRSG